MKNTPLCHCCHCFKSYFFHQQTPLHFAAREGHTATVEYLVEKGADINIRDNYEVST